MITVQYIQEKEKKDMFSYYELHQFDLEMRRNRRAVKYKPHMHDALEVIYMYGGRQGVVIGEKNYELTAGDALVVFPNCEHSYVRPENIPKDNNNADSFIMFIPSRMFYGSYPDLYGCTSKNCLIPASEVTETAKLSFSKIMDEPSLTAQLGWAQLIMSHLIPVVSFEKLSIEDNPEIVSYIMTYLSQNYTKPLSLDILEERLGINKFYISKIFSKKIKVNFRTYLGTLRSNHAAQLMHQTDARLPDIAEASGFESTRSFFRVFQSVYGITPAKYREMVRNQK